MRLKLRVINDNSFVEALRGISGQRMSSKTSYRLAQVMKAVDNAKRSFSPKAQEIIKKYAEYDESGKMIPEHGGPKIRDDKKQEFEEEFSKFLDESEVEIPYKVTLKELEHVQMAPVEAAALDPIISTIEVADSGSV